MKYCAPITVTTHSTNALLAQSYITQPSQLRLKAERLAMPPPPHEVLGTRAVRSGQLCPPQPSLAMPGPLANRNRSTRGSVQWPNRGMVRPGGGMITTAIRRLAEETVASQGFATRSPTQVSRKGRDIRAP